MAMDNVEDIKSIDELRKAQAAAQAQGTSITNYSHWEQILEDLETAGVESTGSYSGDVKLHTQIMEKLKLTLKKRKTLRSNNKCSLRIRKLPK